MQQPLPGRVIVGLLILIFIIVILGLYLTAKAGTFSISSPDTATVKMAMISQATLVRNYNYGAYLVAYLGVEGVGKADAILLHFPTLAALMRQAETDSGYSMTWDSAIVSFRYNYVALLDVDETLYVAFQKLKRAWVEGDKTGATGYGVTWDSACARHTSTNTGVAWTTAGCGSTISDVNETPEVIASRTGYTIIPYGVSIGDLLTVPISGETITDTLGGTQTGGLGLRLSVMRIASDPGDVATAVGLRTDDYSTTNQRPGLTVYFHRAVVPPPPPVKVIGVLKQP